MIYLKGSILNRLAGNGIFMGKGAGAPLAVLDFAALLHQQDYLAISRKKLAYLEQELLALEAGQLFGGGV